MSVPSDAQRWWEPSPSSAKWKQKQRRLLASRQRGGWGDGARDSPGQSAPRTLKELFIQQDPGSHLHTSAPHRLLGCISRVQRPLKVAFSSLSPTAQLVHSFKIIPGGEGLQFALHRTCNKMRSSEAGVTVYLCEISLIALNSLLCKM